MKKSCLIALLLLYLTCSPCFALPSRPLGYVGDFAGILDESTRQQLNDLITEVEQKTTAEIAVATVTSLEGRSIEDYSVALFKTWGIGKKDKNNGVLLLVAPNEKKVHIEVGYGLEPILPDGLCGEIIRQNITPYFKQGDFASGLLSGVQQISQVIVKGEPASNGLKTQILSDPMLFKLIFFVFVFVIYLVSRFLQMLAYRNTPYYKKYGRRGGFFWFGGPGGFIGGSSGGFSSGGFGGGGFGGGGFGGGFSGGGGASGGW